MYVASFSNCVIIGVGRDDRVLAVRIGGIRTVVWIDRHLLYD